MATIFKIIISATETDEDEDKQNEKNVNNQIRTATKISIISAINVHIQIVENIMRQSKNVGKEEKD